MIARERAFPRPTLVLLAGLVAGMSFAREFRSESAVAGVGLVLLAILLHGALRRADSSRVFLLGLGFAGLGLMLTAPINTTERLSDIAVRQFESSGSGIAVLEGRVLGDPRPSSGGVTLWVEPHSVLTRASESLQIPGAVMLRLPGGYLTQSRLRSAAPGDSILAMGHVVPLPDDPQPGRYERFLSDQQAAFIFRAREWDSSSADPRTLWNRYRLRMRRVADEMQANYHAALSPTSASLLAGMSLGRTSGVPIAERDAFAATGLRHLFAVSGLHAGLVGVMLLALGWAMRLRPMHRSILVLAGLFLFCTMVGFRSASVRASLLMAVFAMEPLVGRPVDKLGALSTVALAMLVLWPASLWQLDFQLSFLCAFVLVVCDKPSADAEAWVHNLFKGRWVISGIAGKLLRIVFISACIQAALAPLLLAHFGEVSLISPLANAFVLPMMLPVMALAFAGSLVAVFADVPGMLLIGLLEWPLRLIGFVAKGLGAVPFATLEGRAWPTWAMFLYYAALISSHWIVVRPRLHHIEGVYAGATSCIVALLVIVWSPFFQHRPPLATVTFLDVGQGDAALVQVAEGATMLVDTGPPGMGGRIVSRLAALGVGELDYLVLTHADADHIGGAAVVVADMAPTRILVAGSLANTDVWTTLEASVEFHATPVTTLRRGAVVDLGRGVMAEVLHPTEDFVRGDAARNDASIVMRVVAGDVSFLLTGDAEAEAEVSMIEDLGADTLRATVLKAGHHGSRGSSTMRFLASVRPLHAVLSCGRDNRFGHPHPDVMARLAEMGVTAWRTDLQGEIRFATDGRGLAVSAERLLDSPKVSASSVSKTESNVSSSP
jgi:competence protein ComEC